MFLKASNLAVYSITHAAVDATCAALLFSLPALRAVTPTEFIYLVIVYNIIAFALQILIGLATDYFKSPKFTALSGCLFIIAALIIAPFSIVASVILVGLGNALFHVGAGSIALNLTLKKAVAPGIFVAPGALGLLIGTLIGKSGNFVAWQFLLPMVILGTAIYFLKSPVIDYERIPRTNLLANDSDSKEADKHSPAASYNSGATNNNFKAGKYFTAILILILISIAVRSLVGSVLAFPWKSDLTLLIVLTIAVVLGKGLGGILADKFGWMRIGVGSLALSIPFLILGANIPTLAIIGMFLFNITMPITLVTISNILPGRPGFAFGLTCLGLIFGALPAFSSFKPLFDSSWTLLIVMLVSVGALYLGLRFYYQRQRSIEDFA